MQGCSPWWQHSDEFLPRICCFCRIQVQLGSGDGTEPQKWVIGSNNQTYDYIYIYIYIFDIYIYTLYIHRLYRAQLELGTLYTFHWDTLDAMWEDMTHVSCRPEVLRLDKIDCIDPVCIETERAFAKRLIPICALLVIRFWDWDLWNGRLVFVNTIPGMDYTQPLPPLVQYTGPVVDVKKMEPFSEDVATHGNRRSFFFTTINHNKSKCESIFLWL